MRYTRDELQKMLDLIDGKPVTDWQDRVHVRDPARIPVVLAALREYWLSHPDLRLCQIIGNTVEMIRPRDAVDEPRMDSVAYNIEDDRVLQALRAAMTISGA